MASLVVVGISPVQAVQPPASSLVSVNDAPGETPIAPSGGQIPSVVATDPTTQPTTAVSGGSTPTVPESLPAKDPTVGGTPAPDPSPELTKSLEQMQGENGAHMGMGVSSAIPLARSAPQPLAAAGPWRPSWGVLGMDVSGYQPNVNWSSEFANGAKFAYVKASEGITMTSSFFSSQYGGAYNAGMIRGAYHFALPSQSSATEQADFFVDNGGGWSADGKTLPPLLDIEYNPYSVLGNTCYNMSASQMVTWIRAFSDRILLRTGRLPMIYTTADWWRTCTQSDTSFGANGLHIAAYNTWGPEPIPSGWSSYQMWQFSDSGPFAGDSNLWNGSLDQLTDFAKARDSIRATAVQDMNGDGYNDLVSIRADGGLWFHAGKGNGTFAAAVSIGTGWNIYSRLIGAGDLNGDGKNDLLGLRADGSMWFYAGTQNIGAGNSGYSPGQRIGPTNWDQYSLITGVRDANSDGKNDLVATKADGTLWFIPGTGNVTSSNGAFGSAVKIGTSHWDSFSAISGAADLNSDGIADLLAVRPDGTLWFYAGTGRVSASAGAYTSAAKIGSSGWDQFKSVLGTGDLNGDGNPDVMGIRSDGTQFFYAGTGGRDTGYKPASQIGGSGWDSYVQVVGVGDLDGDTFPDIVAVSPDGALWHYSGNGAGGYKPRTRIGSGWNIYKTIIGAGDLNQDGKPDLLGIRADGTLWFYAGTGKVSTVDSGYAPAVQIGTSWNSFAQVISAGDMNADGKADLLAARSDGSLWFYAGTGAVTPSNGGFATGRNLGKNGWAATSMLIGAKDFNADGVGDVVYVDPSGALWFCEGTGDFSSGQGLKTAVKIGSFGWDAYSALLGVGDFDRNGNNDLVGVNKNGSLWFYSGTAMKFVPFKTGVNMGILG